MLIIVNQLFRQSSDLSRLTIQLRLQGIQFRIIVVIVDASGKALFEVGSANQIVDAVCHTAFGSGGVKTAATMISADHIVETQSHQGGLIRIFVNEQGRREWRTVQRKAIRVLYSK